MIRSSNQSALLGALKPLRAAPSSIPHRPIRLVSSSSTSPSPAPGGPSTPSQAVLDLLRTRDAPSVLASRFYPSRLQPHFLAIRAFNAELAGVKESVSSELLGRIRVGWWRDAVRGAFDNRPAKHPVVLALRDAIHDPAVQARGGLVEDHFIQIVNAREADLSSPLSPPSLDSLESYAETTSSRLYYLSLNLLGLSSPAMDELFSHLGKASGLTLLLSSVPFHAGVRLTPRNAASKEQQQQHQRNAPMSQSQRRLVLPAEYLAQHNVVEEEVYRLGSEARGLKDAVFDTATRANDYLITARTLIKEEFGGKVHPAALGPLMSAVASRTVLERLEALDFDIFAPELQDVAAGRGWRLPLAMYKSSWSRTI